MNDKKIKVSIIMGIYNCEKTLSDCIDSLLNQTYTNWELIMCDDSSTDCTYKIAKRYAEKYNNIILLRNETNKKLSATLNRCLEVAKGEYVARMDADDIALPTRLEK
ncbi:glycosyltransferase family 2 protein, partial [Clostridium perfringens]|nr:glycosyltransferase family 2 protein [Clostridium perfringens]